MDVLCPICGEPWDVFELHDVPNVPFAVAWNRFKREGCAVFGCSHNATKARPEIALTYTLLPDDPDGCAAMFDDFGIAMYPYDE